MEINKLLIIILNIQIRLVDHSYISWINKALSISIYLITHDVKLSLYSV